MLIIILYCMIRIACSEKPQVKPRIKLNSDDGHSTPNRTDSIRQIAGKKITALFEVCIYFYYFPSYHAFVYLRLCCVHPID